MKELRALVHSVLRYLRSGFDHFVFFCPTLPDLEALKNESETAVASWCRKRGEFKAPPAD